MDILSYPIGILIGLFPVLVDLGPAGARAELLLDGRPVCQVTARAPGCIIDLGPAPRIHRLDLVRRTSAGAVSETVSCWINRPGLAAEIHASGDCDERSRSCNFRVGWGHPCSVYAVAADPERAGVLYAGATAGLFRSDCGQVWTSVPLPETAGAVLSLLAGGNGHLFAGTRDAGVFELCLPRAE